MVLWYRADMVQRRNTIHEPTIAMIEPAEKGTRPLAAGLVILVPETPHRVSEVLAL